MSVKRRADVPHTDFLLDVTLWIEIALLAYIIAIWDMPVQTFAPLFLIDL